MKDKHTTFFLIVLGIFAALLFSILELRKDNDIPSIVAGRDIQRSGYLTQTVSSGAERGWALVYEEKGKPALTEQLFFTDESLCDGTLCRENQRHVGDRVLVTGKSVEGSLYVSRLIKEEIAEEGETVALYFYSELRDKDASGNIMCGSGGLVPVVRVLPEADGIESSIRQTISLLLRGEIAEDEAALGITTEFPLFGVRVKDVHFDEGVLMLTFDDPQMKTTGGSCRVRILRAQIEATAKQFPGVRDVRYSPEDVFQP